MRRRLVWASAVAIVGTGIAVGVLALPNHSGKVVQHFRAGKPYVVKVQKQVPVRASDRKAIDRVLDRFVVNAVGRRDPAAAFALTTSALRAGTTKADWRRGAIPVQPLKVRDSTFHGWTPSYSFRNEVNFDLLVHARPGADIGAISYTVDVKRQHGKWRVDQFVPAAMFAAEGKTSRIEASVDYGPSGQLGTPTKNSSHSTGWVALPFVVLTLPVAGLVIVLLFFWRRHRREERIMRAARA
jgi:hypothetical protein